MTMESYYNHHHHHRLPPVHTIIKQEPVDEDAPGGSYPYHHGVMDLSTCHHNNNNDAHSAGEQEQGSDRDSGVDSFTPPPVHHHGIYGDSRTAAHMAMSTVPGVDFDPAHHQFSPEELKPQPIIRKRGKKFVPSEQKDEKYWHRRLKNNVAARRSREARRLKENQIAMRAAFLERENQFLKAKLEDVALDNRSLAEDVRALRAKLDILERRANY